MSRSLRSAISVITERFPRNIRTCYSYNKSNYKDVNRGNFKAIEEQDIEYFRSFLGEQNIINDINDLQRYNVDFLKHLKGSSKLCLRPRTTSDVSKILSYCNDNLLAVVPQGGNTGVCGGATPVFDEIIISSESMNNILSLDETSGILTCEAGCVLQNLDQYLEEYDLMMPLDLGAKGSCHIGGNVSTNAGGIRLYRYGNLHGSILGLEAVRADGEIIDCMSNLKKDNTGFHLKHLFIGSEGCLGFVTKIAIQCPPKPKSIQLAFLGAQNFTKILKAFKSAKHDLGEILSAVEVMDGETMKFMEDHTELKSPIGDYPMYLIIETSGSDEAHDQEKLHSYFEHCMDKHFILNGTIASSTSKREELWSIREQIATHFHKDGYVFNYDFSLPLEYYNEFVIEMRNHMGSLAHRVFGFGHLGDGNLHLQISVKEFSEEILNHIEPYIYKRVEELNGSISAEHGVGFLKKKYLPLVQSKSNLFLMKKMKEMMDPNGILNPYKVIN